MFRRFLGRRCHRQLYRRSFAAEPTSQVHAVAVQRYTDLQSTYPGIFGPKFANDQQKHIEAAFKKQPELVKAWNDRANDMQQRGIRFFYEIGGEISIEALPEFQPPPEPIVKPEPITSPDRDWNTVKKRFAAGEQLIASLDWLKDEVENKFDPNDHKKTWKLMEAWDTMSNINDWLFQLENAADEWRGVKLPVREHERFEWIHEFKKKCPFIGNMEWGSSKSHLVKWEKLNEQETKELKAHFHERELQFLKEVVNVRDPSIKPERWFAWREKLDEVFAPWDLDHVQWTDQAKDLFRAALWQSNDRPSIVEKDFERMLDIIDNDYEEDADIMRRTYERFPEMKFRPEASQRIQAKDINVVAKILVEIRDKVEQSTFQRGVRDVLKPYKDNWFKAQTLGLERDAAKRRSVTDEEAAMSKDVGGNDVKGMWTAAGEIAKYKAKHEEEMQEFGAQALTVEQVAAEVIPRACWMLKDDPRKAQIEAFTQKVIAYATGKGKATVSQLDQEYWALMPHNQGEAFDSRTGVGPSDHAHIFYMCKYDEVKEVTPEHWTIQGLLERDRWELTGGSPFSREGKLRNTKLLHAKLEKHGVDPIILNMLKELIERGLCGDLRDIFKQYKECVQKYNGEVHGVVSSAEDMDQKTFDQIMGELQKANPKKKFFLVQQTDPSLMGGFTIKCGTQTLDFSLLNEVETFKSEGKSAKSG